MRHSDPKLVRGPPPKFPPTASEAEATTHRGFVRTEAQNYLYCKGGSERGEMNWYEMRPGMSWGVALSLSLGLKTMPGLWVGLNEAGRRGCWAAFSALQAGTGKVLSQRTG